MRKCELCEIIAVDDFHSPPSYTVKILESGRTVETEVQYLESVQTEMSEKSPEETPKSDKVFEAKQVEEAEKVTSTKSVLAFEFLF